MNSTSSRQPAVVDTAEFTVRRTIRIAAPVEKVWSAVTEPAAHLPVVRPDRARRRRCRRPRHDDLPRARGDPAPGRGDGCPAPGHLPLEQRRRAGAVARRARRRPLHGVHVHARTGRRRHPAHRARDRVRRGPPTRPPTSRATGAAGRPSSTSWSPCSSPAHDRDAGPGVRCARGRDPLGRPDGARRGRRLGVGPGRAAADQPPGDRQAPRHAARGRPRRTGSRGPRGAISASSERSCAPPPSDSTRSAPSGTAASP